MDKEKAMELYKQGKNDREIGAALGVNAKVVCKWRSKLGLSSNYMVCSTDENKMTELYMAGYTDLEIAQKLGCTETRITNWRNRNEYKVNSKLFDWQLELSEEELSKIPAKYRRECHENI